MTSDFEDDIFDDADVICGWGAVDFDDELLGRSRRKVVAQAVKRRPQKTLADSNSGSELPTLCKSLQQHHPHAAEPPREKQTRVVSLSPENEPHKVESSLENQLPVYRKPKRKQVHVSNKPNHHQSPKPSPRMTSIVEDNAAIAALGRERRMKVVAAALATNVPRKSGMASVVSASFDGESDDNQDEPETAPRRRPDDSLPSSAPQTQQDKLPRVTEPSTAPAGPIDASKKIQTPLSLPLLSINSDCGGIETKLPSRDKQEASRRWRRPRQHKNSLLPSQDASENWESNFPPSLRRLHSPRKYQAASPDVSISNATSSFTKAPVAPKQAVDAAFRAKELLPSIHQTSKECGSATLPRTAAEVSKISDRKLNDKAKATEEVEGAHDDDESWTHGYDDPEVIAKSMAGLIQALSTFAAGTKAPMGGKKKKRRANLQQQPRPQQQHQQVAVKSSVAEISTT